MNAKKIRVAIAGVGNCASAFVQGLEYYRTRNSDDTSGLISQSIGGYRAGDIEVVAAFDVDQRKVGQPLHDAIFAKPNCAVRFQDDLPASPVVVKMGPILDGIAPHMADHPEASSFRASNETPVDVAAALRESEADVLLCYLPVGSELAVRHYAQACLDAHVALVNCVPVFIASDPEWAARFRAAKLPIVGDDIKSQFGATIVHRMLRELFADRGISLKRTYQLNTGGNTDFLNMRAEERLRNKRISKTEAVQSAAAEPVADENIHIGPSDYVAWQKDNKICFIRMDGEGFGGNKIELELRLSVEDSPNSAGSVIDALRFARLGLDFGWAGPIEDVSAYYMKRPPRQIPDSEARDACQRLSTTPATVGKVV